MKSLLQPAKRSLGKALIAGFALLTFVLMGSVQASAQNYVPSDQADAILKTEVNTAYAQLLNETPGTPQYNLIFSKVNYWNAIRNQLDENVSVATAVINATPAICYPSATADCAYLPKATQQIIIQDTQTLLSN